MSEIEPISGPATTPPASPPPEVTTVAPAPGGTAEAPTQGTGRGRPKGLVRWGVALAVLALMIGAVSVAFALLAGGTTSSSVRGWMPKTTVAYLEVRADLPGDQRAKVAGILAKFPGFADQSSLDAKVDEALNRILQGSGVNWTTDVKPWMAGEVGVAVTPAALDGALAGDLAGGVGTPSLAKVPDDGAVALVAVKDAAAASAWISKQVGGTQTTATYAGGEITLVSGPLNSSLAFAVRGGVLLFGPEKTVKAALDTGGSSPVPSSASFTAAAKSAPSPYIAFGYVGREGLRRRVGRRPPVRRESRRHASTRSPGRFRHGPPGRSRRQTTPWCSPPQSSRKRARAPAQRPPPAPSPRTCRRPRSPSSRSASSAHAWSTELRRSRRCSGATLRRQPPWARSTRCSERSAESTALVGWAGDAAVGAEATGGSFGGGLAAIAKDEAAASRTLQQAQALLVMAGCQCRHLLDVGAVRQAARSSS